jgi:microsomal dipeptidase-like Zn-dependent dipeptidase
MIADLHAHYPMHVVADVEPGTTVGLMTQASERPRVADKLRALILRVAIRLGSDRDLWSGHRISVPYMLEGGVGVVFSVLYRPFEEMDLSKPYAAPPSPSYFDRLLVDLDAVEKEVERQSDVEIRVVTNATELEACREAGAIALVHAVEGGFHLGDRDDEISRNVAILARKGVAYVTVAHLFFRQVATNANAVPFIPDRLYDVLFPQKSSIHLTPRGEALIRAMVEHRLIVDLSHMRPDAVIATLDLLDELDPDRRVPVISSHAGFKFGGQAYMHDEPAVRRIAERDGVIGLIMAQHQLNDGVRDKPTESFEDSLHVICSHIDRIAAITGGHRHIGLGTDYDGFIKPTLTGLEDMRALKHLEEKLREKYGADADLMLSGNALRVLKKAWS